MGTVWNRVLSWPLHPSPEIDRNTSAQPSKPGTCQTIISAMSVVLAAWGRLILAALSAVQMTVGLAVIYIGYTFTSQTYAVHEFIKEKEKIFREGIDQLIPMNVTDKLPAAGDYGAILEAPGYVFMGFGVLMVFWSLLGFVGALVGSKRLLMKHLFVCSTIVCVEIVVAAIIYTQKDVGKDAMLKSLTRYTGVAGLTPTTMAWNVIMYTFNCCGATSYKDFEDSKLWQPYTDMGLPVEVNIGLPVTVRLKTPIVCCKERPIKYIECAVEGGANKDNNNMDMGCIEAVFNKIFKPAIKYVVGIFFYQAANVLVTLWIMCLM